MIYLMFTSKPTYTVDCQNARDQFGQQLGMATILNEEGKSVGSYGSDMFKTIRQNKACFPSSMYQVAIRN